jgi:two-component sensor histidine kinase
MFRKQFNKLQNACAFAEAIVNTVREPLVVLDQDLRVVAASRSFYRTFKVNREATEGKLLFELGDGVWDIPKLRSLLEKILPADGAIEAGAIEAYEIERDFPGIGRRTMCLNARKVLYETGSRANLLLGIEDITQRLILEGEKDDLLRQKDVLLEELQHRVANSLQIIASIIMMKLRGVESEEARRHLQETHQRVMSVAAVQQQLHAAAPGASVELEPYLAKLCEALGQSMIGDNRAITLKVRGDEKTATSRDAESLGLIVTELVINAIKHAFNGTTKDGEIAVAFDVSGTDWELSVTDNGTGTPDGVFAQPKTGLGTGIVNALAKQLNAKVETVSGPRGTSVSVTHATFAARKPELRERSSLEELGKRGHLGRVGRNVDHRPRASI